MRIVRLRWSRTAVMLCLLVTVAAAQESSQPRALPDSPSTVIAQKLVEARLFSQDQQASPSAPPQDQPSPPSAASQQQPASQSPEQSNPAQKPVGTAAAEAPATTGVAASNPAGAAIAPAKQRRVRVLLIKVGAIVGAGVAVGTVAALSSASPSKPPGSH